MLMDPNKHVYVAEVLEDNCWDWQYIYDCDKIQLLDIFQQLLEEQYDYEGQVELSDLRQDGSICWYYKNDRLRVWKIQI